MDNYEIAKERIRPEFLKYDQETMISRSVWSMTAVICTWISAGTDTGSGEIPESWKKPPTEPEIFRRGSCREIMKKFYRSMISSVIPARAGLTGRWCLVNSLPGVGQNNGLGDNAVQRYENEINRNPEAFRQACRELGGTEIPMGDIGFEIPVFPFFPMRLRFYCADEEFPAQLSILFDENTLHYMHYETTYYVVNCLMRSIYKRMEGKGK